mgnify:CR=1 FL=1
MMDGIVEQIREPFLHLIGDIERERLNRMGWVDAGGGDENAPIDDEEIPDVVAASPFVDH